MKSKGYIALLLVSIFMVKFIAIDAHALSTVFSEKGVFLVNKHCKKANLTTKISRSAELSHANNLGVEVIDMAGYCTSQFHFTHFSWETSVLKPMAVFNEHFISSLSFLYLDKVSPPPRLV
ncbi:hypothetical protein DFQ11_10921 [Winogradskyella epiphytica]|uniref:Uncharacterized protein n=1 Tax=Winogradskyella epiphytica TaxID=262005 RepID=A0A2V4XBS3_9FLAO|nr:hypothetical protein [Winogradskyella epiphytica]PYE79636.1 hypothetical protein DFQ11_10921 [Winogradskyella epiphytica]GGW73701.1 hypothetical protein GCM10008085_27450 [Winogradskyella epiphytica]